MTTIAAPSTWAIRTDADGRTTYMLALVADTPEDARRFAREEAEPEIVAFAEGVGKWLAPHPSNAPCWVKSRASELYRQESNSYYAKLPEREHEERPFVQFESWVAQKILAHAKGEPLP